MDYPITDAVARLQNGDTEAFNEIYEQTRQSLYYIILKLVGNAADAEDILQETYLQIYRNIGKLNAPEAFIGWATKIACNAAYSNGRKKKDVLLGEDERDLELLAECSEDFLPAEAVESEAKRQIILQIINQLPLPQRTVILLYYYQEMKVPQIAEIMECSEGTVKSRLNYARNTIRKAVTDEEKRSGKLYAIPALLFSLDAKQLALPQDQFSKIFRQIAAHTSAAVPVGGWHTAVKRIAKKAAHYTVKQKITTGVLAASLAIGIPVAAHLSKRAETPADTGIWFSNKNGSIFLNWNEPGDISAISGYQVFLSRNSGADWQKCYKTGNRHANMLLNALLLSGSYDKVKVASTAAASSGISDTSYISDCALTITQGDTKPPASVAFTSTGNEDEYTYAVTGLTASTSYELYLSDTDDFSGCNCSFGGISGSDGTANVYTISATDLTNIVTGGYCLIREYSNITVDGTSCSYTFSDRGTWTKCTSAEQQSSG